MPRLFTAIPIPEQTRDALARLRAPLPGARWIQPENFHITLRFAGDVDGRVARELLHGLADVAAHGFWLSIRGLGTFGSREPRSIWAGVEPSPDLDALVRANDRAARSAGLPPEKQTFKGHVTLARLQHTRPEAVARYLERNAAFAALPFFVDRFVLLSSRPFKGGGPYALEEEYPLAGLGYEAHAGDETLY